jgi:hypothetical protein
MMNKFTPSIFPLPIFALFVFLLRLNSSLYILDTVFYKIYSFHYIDETLAIALRGPGRGLGKGKMLEAI